MLRIYCRTNLAILPDAAVATPQAKIADIYEEVLAQYDVRPYSKVAFGSSLVLSVFGSLVEPYVGQLAAILRSCLDRAIENSKIVVPNVWNLLARISPAWAMGW